MTKKENIHTNKHEIKYKKKYDLENKTKISHILTLVSLYGLLVLIALIYVFNNRDLIYDSNSTYMKILNYLLLLIPIDSLVFGRDWKPWNKERQIDSVGLDDDS